MAFRTVSRDRGFSSNAGHDELALSLGESSSAHEVPANDLVWQSHVVTLKLPQSTLEVTSVLLQGSSFSTLKGAEEAFEITWEFGDGVILEHLVQALQDLVHGSRSFELIHRDVFCGIPGSSFEGAQHIEHGLG